MGSPFSPVLANLYKEYFETVIINAIKAKDMLWMRNVDDILTFWDNKWVNCNEPPSKLNAPAPSIKFKVEQETDNKIPFLDASMIIDTTEHNHHTQKTNFLSVIHPPLQVS